MQTAKESDFFALVLAECALYGVPPESLSLFRDIHAMLGFSRPVAEKQSAILAGPLVTWRSFPNQPHMQRIVEVERLAYHQRALIAFGGGRPDEMVGRAEILHALGNTIKDADIPEDYQEIFRWAAADTLSVLQGVPIRDIFTMKEWPTTQDDEVVKPGGRLNAAYMEICTNIRRTILANLENHPLKHPRGFLRPWAAEFVANALKVRDEAERENLHDVIKMIDHQVAAIRGMFPDLGSVEDEIDKRSAVVHKAIEDLDA